MITFFVVLCVHCTGKRTDSIKIISVRACKKLVVHDYDSSISKTVCNRAVIWLQRTGIMDFAGNVSDCKIMAFMSRCRYFFTDIGLTYYFLHKIGVDSASIQGMLHENYVFLELRRRVERLKGNEKTYAVEVNSWKMKVIFYLFQKNAILMLMKCPIKFIKIRVSFGDVPRYNFYISEIVIVPLLKGCVCYTGLRYMNPYLRQLSLYSSGLTWNCFLNALKNEE